MKKLLLLLILLFYSCSFDNPFTARIRDDYFPIDITGNFWAYKNIEESEKHLEVKETIDLDGKEAIVLEENYIETYWYKGEGFISRHMDVEINFNGELFQVEYRWQNYIEIPIVKGNTWNDLWFDSLTFYNQPLYRTNELYGKVEAYQTVKTKAGTFKNCYRIKLHITEKISSQITGDSITEKTYYEWYAPDIGLVKIEESNDTWELINYGKKEEGE